MTSQEKERRNKLFYKAQNGYDTLTKREIEKAYKFCEGYKTYLNTSKTERGAVSTAVALAEKKGFQPLDSVTELKPGSKVYYVNRQKSLYLAVLGNQPLSEGISIVGAHIDSPRLDLKPIPLVENEEIAYFKTHYYGGIKKYQWPTIPLALTGVVCKKDGTAIDVEIGENESDPIFCISDLLPHLADSQQKKPMYQAIPAETLQVIIGTAPAENSTEKDRIKLAVLELLNEKYGIVEEDLISAELYFVPAGKSRDIGLDRSLIGAYGHDDKVCAYPALEAILNIKTPEKTAVCILADKEEIGSEGVSGMQSQCFDYFIGQLCSAQFVSLADCFAHSFCLSADVTAAYDPTYADVSDLQNSAKVGYGIALCKYTGSRGKSGASDASAEVVGEIRSLFDSSKVLWQMATLGKVDVGGGGTIAKYMANRNIDTLDAGVPVLSMHAPFELVNKLDVYETYLAFFAFYSK